MHLIVSLQLWKACNVDLRAIASVYGDSPPLTLMSHVENLKCHPIIKLSEGQRFFNGAEA